MATQLHPLSFRFHGSPPPSGSSSLSTKHSTLSIRPHPFHRTGELHFLTATNPTYLLKYPIIKPRATLDDSDQNVTTPVLEKEEERQLSQEVIVSVQVLKNAAKTRKVPKEDILAAFSVIEKAKVDTTGFLETLGGTESPGRTWMLIFTAEKKLKGGRYFPLTAIQRFDAAAKRIENGVYLGGLGYLTFEGGFSWKNRILAFIFECIRIKIGPFNPLEFSLGQKPDREPSTKGDPFFTWFYINEEIAVARGRSGGTAFWCRCHRVANS